MPRRRAWAATAVLALIWATTAALPAAAASPPPSAPIVCALMIGEPIVLRSSDFDPDVLVWDSRDRAIEYAGGGVRSATDVLSHTVLSKPGTRAIVITCLAATVKTKYSNDILDTVGVKITTGPNRGHYGWVTSDDVRGAHTALAPAAP